MKAAVYTAYGPPDVVRIEEVDKPTPGDDELLVKVHATTVNRTDCGYRSGTPFIIRYFSGLVGPKAKILGNEFAGEVEAVGGSVTRFSVGDRVFGYNEGPFGAHAEYMTIAQDASVATIPGGMTFDEVAPATEGSHYALSYIRKLGIGNGQDVMVYGATGAIGSAAVQLLKGRDVHITAVCDTDHIEMVKGLGADRVVDHTADDFTKDDERYDVVFDAVGKSSFGRCRVLLKPGGTYVSTELGPLSQNVLLALVTPLLRGRKVRFPTPTHDQEVIGFLRGQLESGGFRPVVDRRYPLDEIVEAYRYVETGQKIGNVVIDVVASE